MLKRTKFKFLAATMAIVVLGGVLAGCVKKETTNSKQVMNWNSGAEPRTIDPGLNTSVEGADVIVNAFEGLTNLDANDKPIAGVAKDWKVSDDGLKYTFNLRKDAKWSDGKAVTAKDFEFAWKRALDPATASEYASQLYYLKNGEEYNNTGNKDWKGGTATADQVGVKATDDYTLEVELVNPTSYFLTLCATPTYMPVREDVVKDASWTTKADTYISNGPFKLKEWKAKDVIAFVKNDNYWNKDAIKLSELNFRIIEQETTSLDAFKSGQINGTDWLPTEEIPALLKDGTAKSYPYYGIYYYNLNVASTADKKIDKATADILKNEKVRKALNLAINREEVVKNVTKGGEAAATTFVPAFVPGSNGKEFKNTDYFKAAGDPTEAKKLLAEAGFPDGKGFPTLEILYNNSQQHQSVAEKVQSDLKKNLGINVTLRSVERKVHLTSMQNKDYQVSRTAWIADYPDPMTFLDIFVTPLNDNNNNNSGYSNPEYDKLIKAAKSEADAAKRDEEMHKAETILINDLPILPIYYYAKPVAVKSEVQGLHYSPMGYVFFNGVSIK